MALVLAVLMYVLYTQQVACDAHMASCQVNIAVHPEDRLFSETKPDPNVVVVGIDDASIKNIGQYPVPRDRYAPAIPHLQAAGAPGIHPDVSLPDPRRPPTDSGPTATPSRTTTTAN